MAIKINGVTVIDDSRVANVGQISQTGNVAVSAGGNANVAVVTGTGLVVTGAIQATAGFIGLDATKIANGTSEMAVIASGGNIRANVGGATIQTIAADGVRTTGIMSASGNITGNYIFGNGSQLTGIDATSIQNGTSSVSVIASGGNVRTNIGGATVSTVYSGGVLVTGLVSASGNITGGNLSGTNISGTLTTAAQTNITSVGTLTSLNSGAISSSGNVTGANLITGGLITATGNITGGNLSGTNISGTLTTASQTNITSVGTLSSLSVTGNVQGGNLRTAGLISATGSITGGAITGSSLTVSTGSVTCGSIVNANANGVGNIGSSTTYFNTVFAKATSAQYADLAEMYEADQILEPGTVVCFGGTKEVTVCNQDSSARVAGVVSTNPSYIMNAGLEGDHPTAVALTGRVPTRVTGTIRKGDMMVSAAGGRARAEHNPEIGTVIGKALADFDGQDGVIEVVIGRL